MVYSHEGTGKKCQGVIVQVADKVLGKIIPEHRKIWFDEECQRVPAGKKHIKECIKKTSYSKCSEE